MNARNAALRGARISESKCLYVSFELSQKTWRLSFSTGDRQTHRTVSGGDLAQVMSSIEWSKRRLGLSAEAEVKSCYEAGREGFHLHRFLIAQGVENVVLDSSSIEVNRRARRAKSDRIDGMKLLELLMGSDREHKKLSIVRVPSEQQEDDRRLHRERERLGKECTGHRNRMLGLLMTQGVRLKRVGGRGWAEQLQALSLPAQLKAELERESERLALAQAQLQALESSRERRLSSSAGEDKVRVQVHQLVRLAAVGVNSAWVLVMEFFGWRKFRNRRELGGLSGLTPTPYSSGQSEREQGISKAGNRRVRTLLIELAWQWLRYQPGSALSRWFQRRYAQGGARGRRIGIVAVARKLLVALWRYLQHGELPAGARLKAA